MYKYLFLTLYLMSIFISELKAEDNQTKKIIDELTINSKLIHSGVAHYTQEQMLTHDGKLLYEYYFLNPSTATKSKQDWIRLGATSFINEVTFKFNKEKKHEHVKSIPSIESEGKAYEGIKSSDGFETMEYRIGTDYAIKFSGETWGPVNVFDIGRINAKYGNIATSNISPEISNIKFIGKEVIDGKEYLIIEGYDKYIGPSDIIICKAWIDPSKGYLAKRIEKLNKKYDPDNPGYYNSILDIVEYELLENDSGEGIWVAKKAILKNFYAKDRTGKIFSITQQVITINDVNINCNINNDKLEIELPSNFTIKKY